MTEDDWLACADPNPMLHALRDLTSPRKRRLFACECCNLVSHLIPRGPWHDLLATTERLADGVATDSDRQAAAHVAARCAEGRPRPASSRRRGRGAVADSVYATNAVIYASYRDISHPLCVGVSTSVARADAATLPAQADMLRCIFGPLAAIASDPTWLSPSAVGLARAIDGSRAFDRLPILADCLEEAGCDDSRVLRHLRGDARHARGCFAVDIALGRG